MKKKIKMLSAITLAIACVVVNPFYTAAQNNGMSSTKTKMKDDKMKMKMGMEDMKMWSMASQMAAKDMTTKYGKPSEATATMLVWHNNGPWMKTIISKDETNHDFPKTHPDVMEQGILYRVPNDKYDELAEYDGSVNVDRTRGFLSARCDKEENNFLALNLAYDIITGKKDVAQARKAYGEMVMEAKMGNKPMYMQKLMFSSNMNAPDSDMSTIK
jgi:hypothetical protein